MVLERVDSVDPTEVFDYIICGYVDSLALKGDRQELTEAIAEAGHRAVLLLDA